VEEDPVVVATLVVEEELPVVPALVVAEEEELPVVADLVVEDEELPVVPALVVAEEELPVVADLVVEVAAFAVVALLDAAVLPDPEHKRTLSRKAWPNAYVFVCKIIVICTIRFLLARATLLFPFDVQVEAVRSTTTVLLPSFSEWEVD